MRTSFLCLLPALRKVSLLCLGSDLMLKPPQCYYRTAQQGQVKRPLAILHQLILLAMQMALVSNLRQKRHVPGPSVVSYPNRVA